MQKFQTTILAMLSLFNFAAAQHHIVSPQNAVAIPAALAPTERAQTATHTARWDNAQISPETPVSHGIDAVTATQIGASQNIFTFLDHTQRHLFALPNVGTNGGTVSFIFRKQVTNCGGSSGELMYNLSESGGSTWLSAAAAGGCIGLGPINNVQNYSARYPVQMLFTTPNNEVRMLYGSAGLSTMAGATWDGTMMLGLVKDVATTPVILQERYITANIPNIYRPSDIVRRGNSYEFWFAAGIAPINEGDSIIDIWKGTYLPAFDSVAWQLQQQIPLQGVANLIGGYSFLNKVLTFSPDGTKGYLTMLGDLVGGKDSVYVPIVMDFDTATQTFGAPYEVIAASSAANVVPTNTNLYDSLTLYVKSFTNASGSPITPTVTCQRLDASTDSAGNLLLLCAISPGLNSVAGDSPYAYYPGFGCRVVLITKDSSNQWNAATVANVYRYQGTIGTGVDAISFTCNPYISRSTHGNHFFFHWIDTDSSMGNLNPIPSPNLIGCSYRATSYQISDTTNWTLGDADWGDSVYMMKTAVNALQSNAASCEYQIPTVAFRYADPNAPLLSTSITDFHYFQNISYCIDSANTQIDWVLKANNVANQLANVALPLHIFPNPANKIVTVQYQTTQFSPSLIQLMDTKGQIVYQSTHTGTGTQQLTINVQPFSKGLYLLKVTNPTGTATQKLVVE